MTAVSHNPSAFLDGLRHWLLLMAGFAIIPALLAFYSFYTFLFTSFLSRKKISSLVVSGLLTSVFAALIGASTASTPLLYGPRFLFADGYRSAVFILLLMSFMALINGCFGLMIKGFVTWYTEIKIKEELNRKNFEMELSLVKSQLDPHFLFNTINNIDVLIESEPDRASAYLNKLSEMMRFMLYETKTETVPLVKELNYLEKYIALQKIRSSNPAFVHYTLTGEAGHLAIAPMLFIPFIENAFKYVADKKREKAIEINLIIDDNKLIFTCKNNYSKALDHDGTAGGIGVSLIKKRLELLYPDHKLTITSDNDMYSVELILITNGN